MVNAHVFDNTYIWTTVVLVAGWSMIATYSIYFIPYIMKNIKTPILRLITIFWQSIVVTWNIFLLLQLTIDLFMKIYSSKQ